MGYEKIDGFVPLKEYESKSGFGHVRFLPVVEDQHRSLVHRMRSSFAASWLRFILLGCLFLGIFARSMPWKEAEYVIQSPVELTLQDIVCIYGS
jgi:hypothetical protein